MAEAWTQLDVARASIVARREQAEAARIAAEGVAEEARLGARSTLDVLDADQERLQAEAEIVQALRDEYVAAYALLRAMGLLTVEHLKLGIDDLRSRRLLRQGAERPARRLRHLAPSTASARAGSATEPMARRTDDRGRPRRARVARRGAGLDPGAGLGRDRGAAAGDRRARRC